MYIISLCDLSATDFSWLFIWASIFAGCQFCMNSCQPDTCQADTCHERQGQAGKVICAPSWPIDARGPSSGPAAI